MGFIKEATKSDHGRKMKSLFEVSMSSAEQTKQNKTTLQVAVDAMKLNEEDYTEEDWKEVEALIIRLNEKIAEL